MHRSRPSVLAILTAVAACSTRSTRHEADANEVLSQDSTLVATLEVRQKTTPPLPDACGAVSAAARPVAASRGQAGALARQAYDAELLGNTAQARSLLLRASELDGTDRSVAYHLGRASEALGDRTGAMTAYCRYLSLAPTTTESVEARKRVAELSQSATPLAVASIGRVARSRRPVAGFTTRRTTHRRSTAEQRVAVATSGGPSAPAGDDATGAPEPVSTIDHPSTDQPSTASRSQSRGPSRVQSAGIGAVAGAIMGAATGRSVKSAVIGAAAGGIVGTVVGGSMRSSGRGMQR